MEKTGIAVWDPVEIPQKKCAMWRFPLRSIWVERIETEWHVLSLPERREHGDAAYRLVARSQKPPSSQWRHYLHRDIGTMQPSPVLPDRP
ncbi:MAG: hypothetical protein ABSG85_11465, partial [Spirochaetia bacterium]